MSRRESGIGKHQAAWAANHSANEARIRKSYWANNGREDLSKYVVIVEEDEPELSLEEKRKQFEHAGLMNVRAQARERGKQRQIAVSRKGRLQELMKKKGGGSVRMAWRRFFDQDCDGELSFSEFCRGLVNIGYIGDVIALWRELGGDTGNTITLHSVDRSGAEIVDYFANWCYDTFRGPWEFFNAIDDDGSNSLTTAEFVDGLMRYRFFDSDNIPKRISSPELVRKNLFPFLDADGAGAVSALELSFLERDEEKRSRIKQLQREKELLDKFGDMVRPLPRKAEAVLRQAEIIIGAATWHGPLPEHRRRPLSAPQHKQHRSATPTSPKLPARRSAPATKLERTQWAAALPASFVEAANAESPSVTSRRRPGSSPSFARTRQAF